MKAPTGKIRSQSKNHCMCLGKKIKNIKVPHWWLSVARVGYEGVHCEINVNECALQPPLCQNNGGCEDNPVRGNVSNWFVCRCGSWGDLFITGTYCETTFGQCDLELLKVTDDPVCHNGGTCRDFPDYFQLQEVYYRTQ